MKRTTRALVLALILLTSGAANDFAGPRPQDPSPNQQKIDALNEAYRNGLLTPQEYQAKLRALTGGGNPQSAGGPPRSRGPRKQVPVFDPVLGMNFATVGMPEDWILRAGLVHGTMCNDSTSIFFRANSPDGLSGTKFLPRFDWAWASNGTYNPGQQTNCPLYAQRIPAADFLKYMIDLLGLTYIRDLKPSDENVWKPHSSTENATALTRFMINNIEENETVSVQVMCVERPWLRTMRNIPDHQCSAFVYLDWGTPEQLPAQVGAVFHPDMAWLQRRGQLTQQETARAIGQIIAEGQATRAAMDMRFQQHQEMMAVMQRGYDMSNRRAIEGMKAQDRMADDWCDYALGVQKRYDPNTGQTYKTDSNYSYDWVNDDGKTHHLSDNINFNPNGLGTGHWTLTQNVH